MWGESFLMSQQVTAPSDQGGDSESSCCGNVEQCLDRVHEGTSRKHAYLHAHRKHEANIRQWPHVYHHALPRLPVSETIEHPLKGWQEPQKECLVTSSSPSLDP